VYRAWEVEIPLTKQKEKRMNIPIVSDVVNLVVTTTTTVAVTVINAVGSLVHVFIN
jgi:hypothetical protein